MLLTCFLLYLNPVSTQVQRQIIEKPHLEDYPAFSPIARIDHIALTPSLDHRFSLLASVLSCNSWTSQLLTAAPTSIFMLIITLHTGTFLALDFWTSTQSLHLWLTSKVFTSLSVYCFCYPVCDLSLPHEPQHSPVSWIKSNPRLL